MGLVLLVAAVSPCRAESVLAALSSDSEHYRQAYLGFQDEWGSTVPFVVGDQAGPPVPADVVVAFGSRAAMREWPDSALLETCLAPEARPDRPGVLQVELLPKPEVLMERIKELLPRLKTLTVIWSSELQREDVAGLSKAAQEIGVTIDSERIRNPELLPQRLRALSGRSDALWLMPDPTIVNAESFAILREYTRAAHIPFLAPTDGLAEKGATATVAASFREIGRAAADAIKERLDGDRDFAAVHPSRVVVTVNASAAKAVGLDLKQAAGVDRTIP